MINNTNFVLVAISPTGVLINRSQYKIGRFNVVSMSNTNASEDNTESPSTYGETAYKGYRKKENEKDNNSSKEKYEKEGNDDRLD